MKKKILFVIIIGILLVTMQFFTADILAMFEGTDDQSVKVIEQVQSNYTPWFNSIWEPSSDLMETILFAFQTFIGMSLIILYVIYSEKRKERTDKCI